MTAQLLIYEHAVPVSKQKHHSISVKTGTNYDFAKNVNSVPLTAVEFPSAVADYCIIFAGNEDAVMPAVVLGVNENNNLYLSENGHWDANYIPAFVRRYPFVFSSSDSGSTFTLCIDEKFSGCNEEGVGERLFDSEQEMTQYLKNVLNFSKDYQGQFQRTQIFCKKLVEWNLLAPMKAQITLKSGKKVNLGGFQVVNRAKLKELSDEKLLELAKLDELELIHLHLHSMKNFSVMVERLAAQIQENAQDSKEDKLSKTTAKTTAKKTSKKTSKQAKIH